MSPHGGEATNANFIVFGLNRAGLEPTIYRTRGEYANHYTTDAVIYLYIILQSVHLLYKYAIRIHFCFIRTRRINFSAYE